MEIKIDSPWDKESEILVSFPDQKLDLDLIYYEDGVLCVECGHNISWHDWR